MQDDIGRNAKIASPGCHLEPPALDYAMKNVYKSAVHGKIEAHAAGMGVPSPEDVEQRARELAIIKGRSSSEADQADRDQARRELLGETSHEDEDAEPEDAMAPAVKSWQETPGTRGRKIPAFLPQDEANVGERLVLDGVDEALHDEMLEAHKKNIDSAS